MVRGQAATTILKCDVIISRRRGFIILHHHIIIHSHYYLDDLDWIIQGDGNTFDFDINYANSLTELCKTKKINLVIDAEENSNYYKL